MQEEVSEFAAFIGIDWADRKHDVSSAGRGRRRRRVLGRRAPPQSHRGLGPEAPRTLRRPAALPCASSSPHGPIVSALLEHDIFVIFPVNPSTLAKYRLRVHAQSRQDDPTDAAIALETPPVRHREKLKPLRHESPNMRALRRLVEARRDLVQDRVRLTNRLTFTLEGLFPAGSRLVSRQRDRGLRRIPRAMALPARRAARSARDHRRLLPRPQRPPSLPSSTAASTPSSPSAR